MPKLVQLFVIVQVVIFIQSKLVTSQKTGCAVRSFLNLHGPFIMCCCPASCDLGVDCHMTWVLIVT